MKIPAGHRLLVALLVGVSASAHAQAEGVDSAPASVSGGASAGTPAPGGVASAPEGAAAGGEPATQRLMDAAGAAASFLKDNWVWFAAVVGLILLIGAIFLIHAALQRRRAAQAGAPAKARPSIPPGALRSAWRGFISQLPRDARLYARVYPHFLVFGEAGCGKTETITRFTDWRGRAEQFYPSLTGQAADGAPGHAEGHGLEIYMGVGCIAQEHSAALLGDATDDARKAFLRHWRSLYRLRSPFAVVVLSVQDLLEWSPQHIRSHAQAIRGKLALLSKVSRGGVRTRIVITKLDTIEGYEPLSRLLASRGIPLTIELISGLDVAELMNRFEAFERYRPLALRHLSATDYLASLRFFATASRWLNAAHQLMVGLTETDPLLPMPDLERLYLSSYRADREVGNPFASELSAEILPNARRERLRRHLPMAAAAALILLAPPLWQALQRRDHVAATWTALERHREEPDKALLHAADAHLRALEEPAWLLPDRLTDAYYVTDRRKLEAGYVEALRTYHLGPTWRHFNETGATERGLYTLAVLYATRSSPLGELVLGNLGRWTTALEDPQGPQPDAWMIDGYVRFNPAPWEEDIRPGARHARVESGSVEGWIRILEDVRTAISSPTVDQGTLASLKASIQRGVPMLEGLSLDRTQGVRAALAELARDAELPRPGLAHLLEIARDHEATNEGMRESHGDLIALSRMVIHSQLVPVDVNLRGLGDLLGRLLPQPQGPLGSELSVELDHRLFTFDTRAWQALIARSQNALWIEAFLTSPRYDGWPLFREPQRYPDIQLTPGRGGLFAGRGRVPGVYSRAAFNAEARPLLTDLDAQLDAYPLTELHRYKLSSHVDEYASRYARSYSRAWWDYYYSFSVRARTVEDLALIMDDLVSPSSALDRHLDQVALNTSILAPRRAPAPAAAAAAAPGQPDPSGSAGPAAASGVPVAAAEPAPSGYLLYLQQELRGFEPVWAVTSAATGSASMGDYKALLTPVRDQLMGRPAKPAGGGPPTPEDRFKAELSAAERLSYEILADEPGSVQRKVTDWLWQTDLRVDIGAPLLQPIDELFRLGIAGIEDRIAGSWRSFSPEVFSALRRFPFKATAAEEISAADLEARFGPGGTFWRYFDGQIRPVCEKQGGRWVARSYGLNRISLPAGLLTLASRLEEMQAALWKAGERRPLTIEVMSRPLPRELAEGWTAVASTFKVGALVVKGFNQRPTWHSAEIPWWNQGNGVVALELEGDRGERRWLSQEEVNSSWSLLRLLSDAEERTDGSYAWRLNGQGAELLEEPLVFGVRADSWRTFSAVGDQAGLYADAR